MLCQLFKNRIASHTRLQNHSGAFLGSSDKLKVERLADNAVINSDSSFGWSHTTQIYSNHYIDVYANTFSQSFLVWQLPSFLHASAIWHWQLWLHFSITLQCMPFMDMSFKPITYALSGSMPLLDCTWLHYISLDVLTTVRWVWSAIRCNLFAWKGALERLRSKSLGEREIRKTWRKIQPDLGIELRIFRSLGGWVPYHSAILACGSACRILVHLLL